MASNLIVGLVHRPPPKYPSSLLSQPFSQNHTINPFKSSYRVPVNPKSKSSFCGLAERSSCYRNRHVVDTPDARGNWNASSRALGSRFENRAVEKVGGVVGALVSMGVELRVGAFNAIPFRLAPTPPPPALHLLKMAFRSNYIRSYAWSWIRWFGCYRHYCLFF